MDKAKIIAAGNEQLLTDIKRRRICFCPAWAGGHTFFVTKGNLLMRAEDIKIQYYLSETTGNRKILVLEND